MLRNFILVALRNLRKNKLYSVINIAGLAIGVTCSILILLWVQNEMTYDRFLPKYDRLYQVWVNATFDGKVNSWQSVPLPTYEAMKTADHHIKRSVVTGWGSEHLLSVDEGEKRMLKDGYYVSEEFLEMFQFPLLSGTPENVLDDPSSIVITESLGKALFGDEDPVNKIIRVDDQHELKVTGVLKDIPENSSFEFDYLLTWKHRAQTNSWVRENEDNWGNYSFQIFLELNDPGDMAEVQANVKDMLTENGEDDMPREYFLYPLSRWRLYSNFENGVEKAGAIEYIQLFTIIAIFILAIACINFMNLATARSEKRAKEVGIRKSIGSSRLDLIFQFLGESVIISFMAYVLAIILVMITLKYFNILVEKQLYLDFTSPVFWIASIVLILVTGILAGSYPAFYLSSFNPIKTLKGLFSGGRRASWPRKILVVIQFGVAIILMIGSVVIYQQIEQVSNRQLGYDQERLITVDYTGELENKYETIKLELLRSGAVESMTRSNSAITQVTSNNFVGWPGKPEDLKVIFATLTTEYDYTKTMGIKMLEGRDFSKDYKSDSSAIIINKAALDLMDLEDPIGTELDLWDEKRTLIGVTENVLMESLYEEVRPLFIVLQDWGGVVTLRLNPNQDVQASLKTVEHIMAKFNPAYPFDFSFVDVDYQKKYTTIRLTQRLAIIFSVLAILITGLGLFGLATFMAEQRTKEIGIRKVLGASVTNLVALMSRDFSRLVIVAFVIAAPLAWWMLDMYLDRYTIRIALQWWIFPLSGFTALGFALLIVSNQARRAASADPVHSLRNE